MKVYIFKNSYYVGEDEKVTANALSSEEVELADGYELKVTDGVLTQEPSTEPLLSVGVTTTEIEDVPTQAGTREVPTDIISELPVMNWGE